MHDHIHRRRILHFPSRMGLAPRPADAWDLACLRYWLAAQPGTAWRVVEATKVLADEHGCRTGADFDDALSHGETVAACRLVAES